MFFDHKLTFHLRGRDSCAAIAGGTFAPSVFGLR
jgi:hypothetical protein